MLADPAAGAPAARPAAVRGSLLGIPYSFEPPTPSRVKQTVWNPSSDRLLVPHVYGWGYSLNLHALARRVGLVGRSVLEPVASRARYVLVPAPGSSGPAPGWGWPA